MAESESDIRITTDTPYRALTEELWGVYCEELEENWPRYNGTALYSKTSNIRCTLVGNKIVDHSDAVGASPVGAAPTTSSFST